MPRPKPIAKRLAGGVALLPALVLSGCGAGLMAPDPMIEDAGANAFLDRVSINCRDKTIGGNRLADLVNNSQNDGQADFFIDLTTKLYFGRTTRSAYASNVDAFFIGGDNAAGLNCIYSELDANARPNR
jgi:hypothetical protein